VFVPGFGRAHNILLDARSARRRRSPALAPGWSGPRTQPAGITSSAGDRRTIGSHRGEIGFSLP
jgi:hypothetical protein